MRKFLFIITIYIITAKDKKKQRRKSRRIGRTVKFESGIDKYRELKLI